jgi:hypothetical protein
MDLMGISGLILSIAGLGLAIWQLRRTQLAAEAARDAANEAVRGIERIYAITTIQEISSRSLLLLSLVRARHLGSAASAAFELRNAISKYQNPTEKQGNSDSRNWSRLVDEVEAVHERLESAALTNRLGTDEREALVHRISTVHTQITARASRLAAPGASHANP